MDDLARRLAAHPRWEWRPGMAVCADAANPPARMVYAGADGHAFAVAERVQMLGGPRRDPGVNAWSDDAYSGEEVPDLTDAATAGVLLAMLVSSRGGLWDRALESIEAAGPGDGRDALALIEAYGLGPACAWALLDVWGAA